jgi:hypothetical protein
MHALDLRMRVRRTQHDGVHETLEGKIVEIPAPAGNEA